MNSERFLSFLTLLVFGLLESFTESKGTSTSNAATRIASQPVVSKDNVLDQGYYGIRK